MFKKILLGLLLLPAVSLAQPVTVERSVICNRTDLVLAEIAKSEYKEHPVWIGEAGKTVKVAVVVNEKTKTWTIIQYNESIACLLTAGEGYNFLKEKK